MNWARVKIALIAVVAFSVVIQLVQPRRTNPPSVATRALSAHVQVPVQVQESLQRACAGCHSNQTVWPCYSHVAPVSWVVVDDLNQGRRHLNFYDGEAQQSPKQANGHLRDLCKEISEKGMPPFSYRLAHPAVQLKTQEILGIYSWTRSFNSESQTESGAIRQIRSQPFRFGTILNYK